MGSWTSRNLRMMRKLSCFCSGRVLMNAIRRGRISAICRKHREGRPPVVPEEPRGLEAEGMAGRDVEERGAPAPTLPLPRHNICYMHMHMHMQ